MSPPASHAPRAELAQLFARYDLDGDGRIDREELRAALRESTPHIADALVDGAMQALDDDRSGSVDLHEFLAGMELFLSDAPITTPRPA